MGGSEAEGREPHDAAGRLEDENDESGADYQIRDSRVTRTLDQVPFECPVVGGQRKGAGGEIQLTDAIEALLHEMPVLAYCFEGTRFDCGNKLGLVKATLHMALQDPQIGGETAKLVRGQGA